MCPDGHIDYSDGDPVWVPDPPKPRPDPEVLVLGKLPPDPPKPRDTSQEDAIKKAIRKHTEEEDHGSGCGSLIFFLVVLLLLHGALHGGNCMKYENKPSTSSGK